MKKTDDSTKDGSPGHSSRASEAGSEFRSSANSASGSDSGSDSECSRSGSDRYVVFVQCFGFLLRIEKDIKMSDRSSCCFCG